MYRFDTPFGTLDIKNLGNFFRTPEIVKLDAPVCPRFNCLTWNRRIRRGKRMRVVGFKLLMQKFSRRENLFPRVERVGVGVVRGWARGWRRWWWLEGGIGSRGSLLRLDVVRDERKAVEKEICFRKCRCGSQATPYEIISSLPDGGGAAWNTEPRARVEKIAARL